MLVELIASTSLLAIVLCSIFDAHRSLSALMSTASERETREEQLLDKHLTGAQIDPAQCEARPLPGLPVLFWHCADSGTAERRVVTAADGFSLLEVLLTLVLSSLILIDTYPAFRQYLQARAAHERNDRIDSGLHSVLQEIRSRAASAQLIPLGDQVRLLPDGSPLRRRLEELDASRAPKADSPLLLIVEPFLERPLHIESYTQWSSNSGSLVLCGALPGDAAFLAGATSQGEDLFEIADREAGAKKECGILNTVFIGAVETKESVQAPAMLFPLRRFEIVYLDRKQTLRRYFVEAARTEPLLYDVKNFDAIESETSIELAFTAQEKDTERTRAVTLNRRKPEIAELEAIVL